MASSSCPDHGHIQVALRVRPLLPSEHERQEEEAVAVTARGDAHTAGMDLWRHSKGGDLADTEVRVFVASSREKKERAQRKAPTVLSTMRSNPAATTGSKKKSNDRDIQTFSFDATVGPAASQEDVWRSLNLEAYCNDAFEGKAATVLCFGQTGSGKTFTMSGGTLPDEMVLGDDGPLVAEDGVQYRAVSYIASRLQELREPPPQQQQQQQLPPTALPSSDTSKEAPSKAGAAKKKKANGNRRAKMGADGEDATLAQQAPAPPPLPPAAASPPVRAIVKASYLELYNEQINDLLQGTTGLKCRWSAEAQSFYVEELMMVECVTAEDFLLVLREGQSNRHRSAHLLNVDSSRSHVILTLNVETQRGNEPTRYGRLTLVDLAGSERLKDTGSHGDDTKAINRSLFALGNVIEKLSALQQQREQQLQGSTNNTTTSSSSANNKNSAGSSSSSYIPYRSSVLTQLLMDSLNGHSRMLMIACVNPSERFVEESLRTIHYAQRTRHVAVAPAQRVDMAAQERLDLMRAVKQLKAENALLRSALHIPSDVAVTREMLDSLRVNAVVAPPPPPPLAPIQADPLPPRPATTDAPLKHTPPPPPPLIPAASPLRSGSLGSYPQMAPRKQRPQLLTPITTPPRSYGFVAIGGKKKGQLSAAVASADIIANDGAQQVHTTTSLNSSTNISIPPPPQRSALDMLNSLPDTLETF